MANDCWFEMKVWSKDPVSLRIFGSTFLNTHPEKYYVGRVREINEISAVEMHDYKGEKYFIMHIYGCVAWSVSGSTMDSKDLCCGLPKLCKELDCYCEVYSNEPGAGFEEHIIVSPDSVILNRCIDMTEVWWDKDLYPTIEELNKAYDTSFTEKDFEDSDCVKVGGYKEWSYDDASILELMFKEKK